jgi:hypothetical protein
MPRPGGGFGNAKRYVKMQPKDQSGHPWPLKYVLD